MMKRTEASPKTISSDATVFRVTSSLDAYRMIQDLVLETWAVEASSPVLVGGSLCVRRFSWWVWSWLDLLRVEMRASLQVPGVRPVRPDQEAWKRGALEVPAAMEAAVLRVMAAMAAMEGMVREERAAATFRMRHCVQRIVPIQQRQRHAVARVILAKRIAWYLPQVRVQHGTRLSNASFLRENRFAQAVLDRINAPISSMQRPCASRACSTYAQHIATKRRTCRIALRILVIRHAWRIRRKALRAAVNMRVITTAWRKPERRRHVKESNRWLLVQEPKQT